MVDVDFGEGS